MSGESEGSNNLRITLITCFTSFLMFINQSSVRKIKAVVGQVLCSSRRAKVKSLNLSDVHEAKVCSHYLLPYRKSHLEENLR